MISTLSLLKRRKRFFVYLASFEMLRRYFVCRYFLGNKTYLHDTLTHLKILHSKIKFSFEIDNRIYFLNIETQKTEWRFWTIQNIAFEISTLLATCSHLKTKDLNTIWLVLRMQEQLNICLSCTPSSLLMKLEDPTMIIIKNHHLIFINAYL